MESNKFVISRFTYFLLAGIWVFSIGVIVLFHLTINGSPPKSISEWIVLAIFWIVPLLIALISTWGIFQQKSTIIDDDKIKQPKIISGNIVIRWKDITKLEKEGYGSIRIYSNKKRVVISQYLFSNPEKLHEFIYKKLQLSEFL